MDEMNSKEVEISDLPPRRLKKRGEPDDSITREGRLVRRKQLKFHHVLSSFLVAIFLPIPIIFVMAVYRPDLVPFIKSEEVVANSKFETITMDEKKEDAQEVEENVEEPEEEIVTSVPKEEDNYEYYTVQEGDTLYHLSITYFGDRSGEEVIMTENNLTSRELEVGSVLKIPKNKHT